MASAEPAGAGTPPSAAPPAPPRRPHRLKAHGDVRIDDWYWLARRDDPEVIAHLKAENAYADAILAPTRELQERLYAAIRDRVQETDADAPFRQGPWWWWSATAEGRQYATWWRRADPKRRWSAAEVLADARAAGGPAVETAAGAEGAQLVLDENVLAGDSDYFALGVFDSSLDHRLLAYATDLDGSERYTLRFRALDTATDLPERIEGVTYGSAWAADGEHFFYVRPDDAMRPFQVWCHRLGDDPSADRLVFAEADERFYVSVGLTRTQAHGVIATESKTTSEAHHIDAAHPEAEPRVLLARRPGVEYDVEDAGDGSWLVRSNEGGATNFALHRLPIGATDPARLEPVLPHRPEVKLEAVDAFAAHLVITERADGLKRLRVVERSSDGTGAGAGHLVEQPDPVYTMSLGANLDWEAATVRFSYTSLTRPASSIDYDLATRERQVVRQTPVRGHFDPADWQSDRLWATAADGTRVPISLVAAKNHPLDGTAPLLLYGYGAYEISVDPTFSVARLNLLERGVTFAIAHVRGGGELGRPWYEQGRLTHKDHTFSDFIACAEHLIAGGWTSPERLVIRGGSAGGLLMGAVTNLRPELWRAVVAEVPFVDVVTTMSDESLPLTVTERDEWGDPLNDAAAYERMCGYSPYDNVAPAAYPAIYATAGLNDPRVGYWEPAKWVAKIRATRLDERPTLLRTELGAGHGGPSGRYDAWRDEARAQAFILRQVALEE